MSNFIHWNICGVRTHWEDLKVLVRDYQPKVVALQETLRENFTFAGYEISHKKVNPCDRGVSLMVDSSLASSVVPLLTDLEATAARVSVGTKVYTFCNLYLSPSKTYSKASIENLLDQLPRPAVMMGDFNAHHPLWGSASSNKLGEDLEEIFSLRNLCVLNDGAITRLHWNGTTTCIDLTVVDPSIVLDFEWSVLDDTHGSDHYPILLKSASAEEDDGEARYNLNKANWIQYEEHCRGRIRDEAVFRDGSRPVESLTHILNDIVEDCIPKSKPSNRRTKVPWFNNDCKEAKRRRKRALHRFRRTPTLANLLAFRQARAKCRWVMKNAKRSSWQDFCSSLSSQAKASTVWRAIRKIKGKKGGPSLRHLNAGGTPVTDKQEIVNLLASTLEDVSSTRDLNPVFNNIKTQSERRPLNFRSDGKEDYNVPFTMGELKEALKKSKDTAAGLDNIHYQFLKRLPESCLNVLLNVYNDVWESGDFPPSWREALVIPIPKPGKDLQNPKNYRPIALTSCLCKTMERMVNARLVHCLETQGALSDEQCGFRKGRSTTDHLVRFETFIREAWAEDKHVVAIFFDLEKAYDTTWKHGILRKLHELGYRGRMAHFLEGFLESRTFKVRAGSTYSDTFEQEMGVPQGSILSPTLFNVQINDIAKVAKEALRGKRSECSLFVDDFALCVSASTIGRAERALQGCVNKVQEWVCKNGFKFSENKTVAIHFWKGTKIADPSIFLNRTKITAVNEARFLGLIFDRRLTFKSHIQDLKLRCLKSLNVLKVVSHTDWGADSKVLLRLYQALVRSKLDYGCCVYGSAAKSNLKDLNTIHNAGIRIALGAFRTSPIPSLYTEAGETSLEMRRLKLALNYVVKLKSMPDNPAYNSIFNPKHELFFEAHPNTTPPLSLRVAPHLEAAKLSMERVELTELPTTPPWMLEAPKVHLGLTNFDKSLTNDLVYQQAYGEFISDFNEHEKIFTDGSKSADAVGAASVSGKDFSKVFKARLPNCSSIFSAEMKALCLALRMVYQARGEKFLILSDSLSSLIAIQERKLDHPFLIEFSEWFTTLLSDGKNVELAWIPSHVGIKGNEAADTAAKAALAEVLPDNQKTKFSDLKAGAASYVKQASQAEWEKEGERDPPNKLFKIQPIRSDTFPRSCKNRKEESVLSRLHIGHTYITHRHRLAGEAEPICIGCDEPLTVEHILVKCWDFYEIRRKHYSVENFKVLFRDVPPDKIFDFLKEVGLFYKI